ncbi:MULTISPECIES: hypothetical protein [unclassified Nocardia]|uniref:hypothetical protein n=1 Tax=unclassified Nocardia TaxID=2637762 RepID=UPI00278C65AF|nr:MULTISPECIES: hypothetical protein [unclassified Nocardia]
MSDPDTDPFFQQLDTAADRLSDIMNLRAIGRDTSDAGYRAALQNAVRALDAAALAIRAELGGTTE